MHMTVILDYKIKGNLVNIEKALQHLGLRKIQPTLYGGEL